MGFRITGSLVFDPYFMKKDSGGMEKLHLISDKQNVLVLQNLGGKWLQLKLILGGSRQKELVFSKQKDG